MGGPVSIIARVYATDVKDDAELYITGNHATLGNWDPKQSRPLTRKQLGWFEGVIHLPFGFRTSVSILVAALQASQARTNIYTLTKAGNFEYKYCIISQGSSDAPNIIWENINNRIGHTQGKTTYLVDHFGDGAVPRSLDDGQEEVRVMSFNIRLDNPADGIHRWDLRKDYVAQMVRLWKPQVVGFQEVLHRQLEFLASSLSDRYSWIGVGRDDGGISGEYCPIFYNHHELKLLDQGTFWLSETPWNVGSRSWKSACTRICTWIKLQLIDHPNSPPLFVFNTHLDHQSSEARIKGLELINSLFHAWTSSSPGLICGDFNEIPEQAPISTITHDTTAFPSFLSSAKVISENPFIGPDITFPNWDGKTWASWIDYILVKPWMRVTNFSVIEQRGNKLPISDHFPIIADICIAISQN
jgi:endonuclease/exonuclease/phosphatase family metal-dependent hydrolase